MIWYTFTFYLRLRKRLSSDYGFDVTLKYNDSDDDLITLNSQNDLDVLFQEESDTVNVTVYENMLPNVHSKKSAKPPSLWPTAVAPSSDWTRNPGTPHAVASSPVTSSIPHLQPLRTTSRFDRFPVIETNSPRAERLPRWKKGEVLGQGAFGIVCLGLNVETGELMVTIHVRSIASHLLN